jgi:hypothetical protein
VLANYWQTIECEDFHFSEFAQQHQFNSYQRRMRPGWDFGAYLRARGRK